MQGTDITVVHKGLVSQIHERTKAPHRAGVIMYTVHNGCTYFCVGLDAQTHDLSDLAGSVRRKYETGVGGALREFEEESLGIFEEITESEVAHCPVIYTQKDLVIFIRLEVNPHEVCEKFAKEYQSVMDSRGDTRMSMKWVEPEMCALVWLTWEELVHAIRVQGVMYERIRRLLQGAGDFSDML